MSYNTNLFLEYYLNAKSLELTISRKALDVTALFHFVTIGNTVI